MLRTILLVAASARIGVAELVNIAVIGDSTCDTSHPGNAAPPQFPNVMGFGSLINTFNSWDYSSNDSTHTYRGAEKNLALLWKPIRGPRTVGYVVSKCILGLETWQFYEMPGDHSWLGTVNDTIYKYDYLLWTLGENDRWCGWMCNDPTSLFDTWPNVSCHDVIDGKTPCNDPTRTGVGKDYGGCRYPLDPVSGQVPGYCSNEGVVHNPARHQCKYDPTLKNTCVYKSYYAYTKKMLDEAGGNPKSILVTPAPYLNELDSYTYDDPNEADRKEDIVFHQQLDAMTKQLYHERIAKGDVVALLPLYDVLLCYYKAQNFSMPDFNKMRDVEEDFSNRMLGDWKADRSRREYRHMTVCGALVHSYALLSLLNAANITRVGEAANIAVVEAYWQVYCPSNFETSKLDTCMKTHKPLTPPPMHNLIV